MSLQGSIETFAVADVLRLLAATSKTGRLQVQGPTRSGTVWVRHAQILGAESVSSPFAVEPADVVFQLLRFERGSFRFELDELPADEVAPSDIEVVLAEAEAMLGEWRDLEARIPSAQSWVTLQPQLRADAVTLDPDEWSAVVMISVGCSVADLGTALRLGELHTARVVARLLDLGLVDVGEASDVPVDAALPVPPVPLYDDAVVEPVPASAVPSPVWEAAPMPAEVAPAAALGASAYGTATPADAGYVSADAGYVSADGPAQTEPEPAWFVAPVAPAAAPVEDLYAYPGLAVAPPVASPIDWSPAASGSAGPPPATTSGDAGWIGSLAEAIEQVGAPATWPTSAEPSTADPWAAAAPQAPVSTPAAPTVPTPLAPVGSFGGPTSLFKSGPPERLAPPPPPPPARFDTDPAYGAAAETGDHSPASDTDLEQQLFNLSPRARQAIKQSAGLQQGFTGR